MEKFKARELGMLPPTMMSLQLIRKCNTVQEAKELLIGEKPISVLPVLKAIGGKMLCLYEGDAEYDETKITKKAAKHRLTIDMTKGEFHFEFENCEGVHPVNGGMHI